MARRAPTSVARSREVRRGEDTGSAVVEFVVLGVLLLVPVVYLVLCVGRLQAAAFAVEGASREAARVVAGAGPTGPGEADARRDAEAVVELALADQGFDLGGAELVVRCSARPCGTPEAVVEATVSLDVVLPGVPAPLAAAVPALVPVEATGTAVVDRFRALP